MSALPVFANSVGMAGIGGIAEPTGAADAAGMAGITGIGANWLTKRGGVQGAKVTVLPCIGICCAASKLTSSKAGPRQRGPVMA